LDLSPNRNLFCLLFAKARSILLGLVVLLNLALCLSAISSDKNGVAPGAISVPKGPGSIEGLGESFQPTLNTGTAKYEIALKVPPGTAGLAPDLKLLYEAGNGNGPVGFGWEFAFDFVQCRTDHGVPTYGRIPGIPRADTFITDAK